MEKENRYDWLEKNIWKDNGYIFFIWRIVNFKINIVKITSSRFWFIDD